MKRIGPRSAAARLLAALALACAAAPLAGSGAAVAPGARGDDPAAAGRPSFEVFDDADGLPQNGVTGIALDGRRYLWVATQDGAAHFNGRVWTAVHMPDRRVSNYANAVCLGRDGALWFATNQGGVVRLGGGEWSVFGESTGLPSDNVRALLASSSPAGEPVLWAGTARGVARLERGRWTVLDRASGLGDESVFALAETEGEGGERTLWAGTEGGLWRYERGGWTGFGVRDGLPDPTVQCLLPTRDENGAPALYVGTNGGLARFENGGLRRVAIPAGFEQAVVRSLLETTSRDGSRTLWVGTIRAGLLRLERGSWAAFGVDAGLPTTEVSALFETRSESGARTLWAGLNGGGLVRASLDRWRAFDAVAGQPGRALSFLDAGGGDGPRRFLLGTRAGIVAFENGAWRRVPGPPGLEGRSIRCMLETRSPEGGRVLWAGTTHGLARLEDGRWRVLTEASGLPGDEILGLSQGGDASLLVSTGSGLARIEGDRVTAYGMADGLPHDRVQCALETRDADGTVTLWAGTDGGLARLRGGAWTVVDSRSGLVNDVVLGLHVEPTARGGRLWVGTFGGLSILDLGDPAEPVRSLTDASVPALPNNTVYQIRGDAAGRFYLTTNRGVARLTRRAPSGDDPAEFAVYTFTTADGLPSNECDIGASYVDARGRLWVGTVKGVAMLDPSLVEERAGAAPLVVEQTSVGGAPRPLDPEEPLGHYENSLVFEYALLEFFREGETRYRTQLAGLEEAPTDWTADAKREVSNLPPGDYVFTVWARDYAGTESGPVPIPFAIRPAPWRTWWAYGLYAALAVGSAAGLARVRTRALRLQNEQLERRIRERTLELAEKVGELEASERRALEASRAKSAFLANMSHELRTPLNAILGFVQLMGRGPDRSERDREHLLVIGRSGEHLLSLINDVLSLSKIEAGQLSIAEREIDLARLLGGVEEMFRYRAEEKSLQFIFEADPEMPAFVRGDDGKLRQVLINLLGNAFKFTDEGGVALRARWSEGVGVFEVEDTGPGIGEAEMARLFEAFVQTESGLKSTEGTGLGLAISKSYVELMGGEIRVRSELGRGTRFTFDVPLPRVELARRDGGEPRVVGLAEGQEPLRVLVVDDKVENRRLLGELLAEIGFEVREASDGAEAVGLWESWAPHLVWMDIKMPVMDGYEATRRIRDAEAARAAARPTRIIAVTASAFAHDRDSILAAGCDDFVPKPFRSATILEKMAEHLGVRYASEPAGAAAAAEPQMTPARLGSLPSPLLAELNRAIVQGDVSAAARVADEIGAVDAPLGAELHALIRSYRFDEIQEMVGGL